jgi:hypothetical protein
MKRIVSVSRRTDIPAFYGDWFMRRLREGFAGVVSPYGGKRHVVSLKNAGVRKARTSALTIPVRTAAFIVMQL